MVLMKIRIAHGGGSKGASLLGPTTDVLADETRAANRRKPRMRGIRLFAGVFCVWGLG